MISAIQSLGRRPLAVLAAVSVLSIGARSAFLGAPCRAPCRTASDRVLVFDETYYVNAARVIAGLSPPPGQPYAGAPAGDDPNSEHPQLAKLIMAGAIELFGDGPFAWRLGSILAGSLAILGMYALTRAAGAGRWLGVGAATLMASDNLLLVHGRIGTLDIYALAAMVWAATFYLRGRPLLAGGALGVGAAFKEVAPYLFLGLVLLELLRWLRARGAVKQALWRLGRCAVTAAVVLIGLLAVMDRIAPPYDPVARKLVSGGPLGHLWHILSYATQQTSPNGPRGIASYPWQWLIDLKPITYLNINPARPADGLYHVHPAVHFLGMISPPVLLAGMVGLVVMAWQLARPGGARLDGPGSELSLAAIAWFLGTFIPFEVASVVFGRTSYLYYMVIVMPALYLAAAALMGRLGVSWVNGLLVAAMLAATIVMYPLTPLP